jgi:hypothetical protein
MLAAAIDVLLTTVLIVELPTLIAVELTTTLLPTETEIELAIIVRFDDVLPATMLAV